MELSHMNPPAYGVAFLDVIPLDVIYVIHSMLQNQDLGHCSRSCKAWRNSILKFWNTRNYVQLGRGRKRTDAALLFIIQNCPQLKILKLNNCSKMTPGSMLHIKQLTTLESLVIELFSFQTSDEFQSLASLTNLRVLELRRCQNADNNLDEITRLTSLRNLETFRVSFDMTNHELQSLTSHLLSLKELNLVSTMIEDTGLVFFTRLTRLESFSIRNAHLTDGSVINSLARLTSMHSLKLWDCRVTDLGVGALTNLKNLRLVRIGSKNLTSSSAQLISQHCTMIQKLLLTSARLTDNSSLHFEKLPLRKLELWYCSRLTDQVLIHVGKCTSLTTLNLGHCKKITNAGLAYLSGLTTLTELKIQHCYVTSSGLHKLSDLTELTSLSVGSELIDSKIFSDSMAVFPKLRFLCILEGMLLDHAFDHLPMFTSLKRLTLKKCTALTPKALRFNCTHLSELILSDCPNLINLSIPHVKIRVKNDKYLV